MNSETHVTVRQVPSLRVLAIRRSIDGHQEALALLDRLREASGVSADEAGLCMTFGRTADGRIDAELALPVDAAFSVSESLEGDGAQIKVLPADVFLHIEHVGPYQADEERDGIQETIGRLSRFAQEHSLLIGDNPSRYVYREGAANHGEAAAMYRTDVLVSYHLPIWLRALREGVEAAVGEEPAGEALAGAEAILQGFDADRVREWVRSAVERVDGVVEDARTRACILNGCAHRHPQGPLDKWKAAYGEAGSLDAFIDRLIEDKELYPPRTWRGTGEKKGVLFVERIIPPWNRAAYDAATAPKEKRYHACFCSMMKEAILKDEPVSPTFCDCSGGWFVQIWEAILGKTLRVDVVNSVLQGDERCVFGIYLPVDGG